MVKYPHEKLYAGRMRPHVLSETGQPEGFSTQANINKWSARASANSGPRIAPGTNSIGDHQREEDRRHVEPSRVGWAAKRGK
jgi:hypothetical protein